MSQVAARDVEFGATPLHWAAAIGDEEVVRLLLHKGADVKARMPRLSPSYRKAGTHGQTAQTVPADMDGESVLGLDLSCNTPKSRRPSRPSNRPAPNLLCVCYCAGRAGTSRPSLKPYDPQDPDLEDRLQAVSWDGFTPVHAAAAYGHAAVLHMLLTFGGDPKLATPSGVRAIFSALYHP